MNVVRIVKSLIASLIACFSMASPVSAELVVEWAPFVKSSQTNEQQLISNADAVNHQFLSLQPGFIKRSLVKKDKQNYADIVYWKSLENAQQAAEKVAACKVCNQYFALMDFEKSKFSGSGFSYYKILKEW